VNAPKANDASSIATAVSPLGTLLVEDHIGSFTILKKILESLGLIIITANSGRAALEAAMEPPFDTLVSDLGLPDRTDIDSWVSLKRNSILQSSPSAATA
jgi:CheY-like chemotaxis protein